MEFELKKVKCFPAMSEETEAFTAQLWENGKHVANIKNDGQGGCHRIDCVKPFTYKDVAKYNGIDMECTITERVIEMDEARKYQSKGFFLKKDGKTYNKKFPMSITKLKKHPQYPSWLLNQRNNLEAQGYQILNTNL